MLDKLTGEVFAVSKVEEMVDMIKEDDSTKDDLMSNDDDFRSASVVELTEGTTATIVDDDFIFD